MLGRNLEVSRESVHSSLPCDVEQHAAPEDRSDGVHRVLPQAARIRLCGGRVDPAMQLSAAGKMAERVDMRSHVAAERQRFGRGAYAAGAQVVPMLLR